MKEPTAGRGTILTMECPECGRIGLRFITGETALEQWEQQGAVLGIDGESPATLPSDTTVVFCSEECGHVEYGDIDWAALPPTAVKID